MLRKLRHPLLERRAQSALFKQACMFPVHVFFSVLWWGQWTRVAQHGWQPKGESCRWVGVDACRSCALQAGKGHLYTAQDCAWTCL